jgi:uncharacterized protein YjbI with pentapeptide repeats
MPRVFISYRRKDSDVVAGRLRDALVLRLADVQIFLDVSGIEPGQDFKRAMLTALSAADVVLPVIGPGWLNAQSATGSRRLDDPEDFVRLEIVAALASGALVIPVLVQGAAMPRASDVPDEIRDFTVRQAFVLSAGSWKDDVEALAARIEAAFAERAIGNAGPPGAFERLRRRLIPNPRAWRLLQWTALAVVFAAALAGGYRGIQFYRTRDLRNVQGLARDLRYELPLETVVGAMSNLQTFAGRSDDASVTNAAVAHLKTLVVKHDDTTDKGREIRQRALEAIKALRHNDLTSDFSGDDLTSADLVGVDLSRTSLKGVRFARGFLLRTNFAAADLTGADLSATWVRNADFGAATMAGADISEMDWFNAVGLTAEQLRSVDRSTLVPCPKDDNGQFTERGFRKRLDREYTFKWEQFGSDRDQLRSAWSIYGQSGGLCEQVDTWLAAR